MAKADSLLSDIERYRRNLREEVDGAALYRLLAGTRYSFDEAAQRALARAELGRCWYPESGHGVAVGASPSRLDDLDPGPRSVLQDAAKTDQNRRLDPAHAETPDQLLQVDRPLGILGGMSIPMVLLRYVE